MMKKTVMRCIVMTALLLLPLAAGAQHNRKSLLQPDYDDYNLRWWPRHITVVQRYEGGNDINFQETYSFDSSRHVVEYRKRGFGGEQVTAFPLTLESISRGKLYTFDFEGDISEMRRFDQQGRLVGSTHYIYNVDGLITQTVEYAYRADSGVVERRTVTLYDKHERVVRVEQYTADELLLWQEKRSYDRRGNLAKRVQTFHDGDETTVHSESRKYVYDNHGNWTLCSLIVGGKIICTIERKIDYYGE